MMKIQDLQKRLSSDKALHFVYAFLATSLIYTILQIIIALSAALGISALFTIVLAFMKEKFADKKFDAVDLGFSVVGSVSAVLIILLQSWHI